MDNRDGGQIGGIAEKKYYNFENALLGKTSCKLLDIIDIFFSMVDLSYHWMRYFRRERGEDAKARVFFAALLIMTRLVINKYPLSTRGFVTKSATSKSN